MSCKLTACNFTFALFSTDLESLLKKTQITNYECSEDFLVYIKIAFYNKNELFLCLFLNKCVLFK